jgi:aminopeptidase N
MPKMNREWGFSYMQAVFVLLLSAVDSFSLSAQPERSDLTHADTLRGALSPDRTCYDVTYYHLDVRIDPSDSSVRGANTITFVATEPVRRMQIDLFRSMEITEIRLDSGGPPLRFARDGDAFFVDVPRELPKGSHHSLRIAYEGKPLVAKNPPWQGGFTWERDRRGKPWVVVTCQGIGASLWWPNKDQQADEPDSMRISITVPPGLQDISNGRLRNSQVQADGWVRYDWFVSAPINNYSVTVNIGSYAHFSDMFVGADTVTLDYYVLPENLEKARGHFAQVKDMMKCFEEHFGPYPFARDGYKLVECPHTGMEHQSAVAYGNWYLGGYRGRAPAEVGLTFDFIIIHESAHEWWGNSVTAKDVADMWIHESFGAYAEALYVECLHGYQASLAYINGKKPGVGNRAPIIGVYGVNRPGSGDRYNKGQLMLNTLRSVIDNDSLWFATIKGLATTFRWRTVEGEEVFAYVQAATGNDYRYFFDQYLRFPNIPVLEVGVTKRGNRISARYRWNADVRDFRMPVRVTLGEGEWGWIRPTTDWQTLVLGMIHPEEFRLEADRFYADLKLSWTYLDERTPERTREAK